MNPRAPVFVPHQGSRPGMLPPSGKAVWAACPTDLVAFEARNPRDLPFSGYSLPKPGQVTGKKPVPHYPHCCYLPQRPACMGFFLIFRCIRDSFSTYPERAVLHSTGCVPIHHAHPKSSNLKQTNKHPQHPKPTTQAPPPQPPKSRSSAADTACSSTPPPTPSPATAPPADPPTAPTAPYHPSPTRRATSSPGNSTPSRRKTSCTSRPHGNTPSAWPSSERRVPSKRSACAARCRRGASRGRVRWWGERRRGACPVGGCVRGRRWKRGLRG